MDKDTATQDNKTVCNGLPITANSLHFLRVNAQMHNLDKQKTAQIRQTLAARLTDDSAKIIVPTKNIRLTCCRKSDNNGGKNKERATNRSKKQ